MRMMHSARFIYIEIKFFNSFALNVSLFIPAKCIKLFLPNLTS